MASFTICVTNRKDATRICDLLKEYMRDELRSEWPGSIESVLRDGFGKSFDLLVAVSESEELLGFAPTMRWREFLA